VVNEVNFGEVTEQHDKIIITGSGLSINNFFQPDDSWKVISVNNSVNHPNVSADYWFTLDLSLDNQKIAQKRSDYKKYVAIPGNIKQEPRLRTKTIEKFIYRGCNFLERISSKQNCFSQTYGLQTEPNKISTGNSLYGALNLAYHMNPKYILIIGLDGEIYRNKFDGKVCRGTLRHLDNLFSTALPNLKEKRIKVYNCNSDSEVKCFEFAEFNTAINRVDNVLK